MCLRVPFFSLYNKLFFSESFYYGALLSVLFQEQVFKVQNRLVNYISFSVIPCSIKSALYFLVVRHLHDDKLIILVFHSHFITEFY